MKTKKTLWLIKNQNNNQCAMLFDYAKEYTNAQRNDEIIIGEYLCKISNVIWSPTDAYLKIHQCVDLKERVFDSYNNGNVEIVKMFVVHPVWV